MGGFYMLCGLAALDITPKLGENIPGYFEARHASGVREPLAVRAQELELVERRGLRAGEPRYHRLRPAPFRPGQSAL